MNDKSTRKPLLLMILDGWGYRPEREDNAIALAATPCWDELWRNDPHGLIETSGAAVGLPEGQMGNSEVGHMNIGAGRIVFQDYSRIENAIRDGSFRDNPQIRAAIEAAVKAGRSRTCHGAVVSGRRAQPRRSFHRDGPGGGATRSTGHHRPRLSRRP